MLVADAHSICPQVSDFRVDAKGPIHQVASKVCAEFGRIHFFAFGSDVTCQDDAHYVDDAGQLVSKVVWIDKSQTLGINAFDSEPVHQRTLIHVIRRDHRGLDCLWVASRLADQSSEGLEAVRLSGGGLEGDPPLRFLWAQWLVHVADKVAKEALQQRRVFRHCGG